MPVFLTDEAGESVEFREFSYSPIEKNSLLQKNAKHFIENSLNELDSIGCLYSGQREIATVRADDPMIHIVGSDDATTCHIVLIVDAVNKHCSVCHFDGTDVENGVYKMIRSLKDLGAEDEFFLYIVGGFDDDRNLSIDLTIELFEVFIKSDEKFFLKLCLVTELNDKIDKGVHYPIAYGLAYEIKESNVFMCNNFLDKGPDSGVRGARHFSDNQNLEIYDYKECKLKIGPFDYEPMEYAAHLLNEPPQFLLKNFSTSPEQEPFHFVDSLRRTFRTMIEHPRPLESYFQNGTRVYTKLENGQWIQES